MCEGSDAFWNGKRHTASPKKRCSCSSKLTGRNDGFNGIFLLPVNVYGPPTTFDLESSHVIPAMIRKFSEARRYGDEQVELWGDGSPTREFL